ncbi:hypothetical protein JCGZ_18855 [Jatropha curcas]|uniref:Terpene synthase metal-binding domain-containing protein n=1 Tax=Jatropha curcas TaxID=180498 RepID=A0A067K697_JATCU|nr:hypothetical protein JCGZ_18855 [Jatropha curcas]
MTLQAATQTTQVHRTAEFHPSVWGDYFIKHVSDNNIVSVWSEEAEVLKKEVREMLSSAAASYLSIQGETILDEAFEFTKTHLIATQLSSPPSDQVSHALRWPARRGLPRKEAWHYFSIYKQREEHSETLLKLAKLDYNIVHKLHQKDMSSITKWWMDLDFTTKLPFARDRVIECSFWALGTFSEPHFVFARKVLSKAMAMVCVMDDIYDVHGTIEELELFTKVIERIFDMVWQGLARLINDIMSHEFEQERGHVASAVECCMKQYGVSKQEAYEKLNKIVANMWKDLNEELMKEIDIPKPILMCILNIVRVMDVVYKDEDSYTHSNTSLKDILATFLVNPVAV